MGDPIPFLPPVRDIGYPADTDLGARRAGAAGMTPAPVPEGVTVTETEVGGVVCVECATAAPRCTYVHFHGGGYRLGAPAGWTGLAGGLAARLDGRVVVPDYRLAPEHPFPAALHDGAAVYLALAAATEDPMVVGGDSAGGGLALALAVALRDGGVTPPVALVLVSPWVDLTGAAMSYVANADRDQLFSAESAHEAAALYLQGHDPRDPLASPRFADLHGLPPTVVFVGTEEVLLDDACSLAHALGAAGVRTELHVAAGMQHVWPLLFPDRDESRRVLDDAARFVTRASRGSVSS
jgi:acetyl esterase/lipase